MTNLGELLRKARIERGMSLDDLQEGTKIRKRYLEAIEEGKYSVLPGNFYARAFIKQYSEAVGLDADEILRLYANDIPPPEQEMATEPIRMKRRAVAQPERSSKWASILLMIAFPLLIIGVIYYYSYNGAQPRDNVLENTPLTDQRESEQTPAGDGGGTGSGEGAADGADTGEADTPGTLPAEPDQAGEEPAAETPDSSPEQQDVVFVENFRAGGAEAERFDVKNTAAIKIEMKVIGSECWVGIRKTDHKGDYLFQKGFAKDDTYVAEFNHPVFVNIGRANALELKVNGVLIDLGTDPDPRKFQFDLVSGVEISQ